MPDAPAPPAHPRTVTRRAVAALVVAGCAGAAVVVAAIVVASLDPTGSDDASRVSVGASAEGYAVWERNDDGTPVRWDGCSPIEVVVSPGGAPDGVPLAAFGADVEAAVADLREATGLDLRVAGTTTERPRADRGTTAVDDDGRRRWAPVLVGWRDPARTRLPLRDSDRAIAVPVATGPAGARQYVTGQVALNAAREDLVPGRDDRATSWGATILHELAHVLGLAHVDDADELLATHPGSGPVALGPGDRAGLAAVGAAAGCLDQPPPRELEVELPDR